VSFTIYDLAKLEGRNVSAEYPTESAPEGVGRYLSGTLGFEVLTRARFRCESCGVSADGRALEVGYIVPCAGWLTFSVHVSSRGWSFLLRELGTDVL
jgi:hypothetical protein